MENTKKLKKYEAPRMMGLGNLSTGYGTACQAGSTATGNCSGGSIVTGAGQCNSGAGGANNCNAGTSG